MSPAASSTADALRAAMNAARKAQDKDRTLVLGASPFAEITKVLVSFTTVRYGSSVSGSAK